MSPSSMLPPFGELDQASVALHEMYQSYQRAGFSRREALELVKATVAAMAAAGAQQDDGKDANS